MIVDNRYWAGLFDGEGSIYIARDLTRMTVSLTQKETAVLYLLKARFGGALGLMKKQNCYRWVLCGSDQISEFLKAIAPFSIIKAVEIQVAIELCERFKFRQKGRPLADDERNVRYALREKLMADRKEAKQEVLA